MPRECVLAADTGLPEENIQSDAIALADLLPKITDEMTLDLADWCEESGNESLVELAGALRRSVASKLGNTA